MANDLFQAPVSGLWTAPNSFAQAPAGSLAEADDVYFLAPGVLGPRPGFPVLTNSTFGSASSRADQLADYDGDLLSVAANIIERRSPGGSFSSVDTQANSPSDNRVSFAKGARNIYYGTSVGVRVLSNEDDTNGAGMPQGLDAGISMTAGTGAWMEPDTAVAYRFTVCSIDGWGRVIEGPPSGRIIVRNRIRIPIGGLVRNANVVTATAATGNPHYLAGGETLALTPGEANFPAANETVASVTSAYVFTYADAAANATSTAVQDFEVTRFPTLRCYLPTEAPQTPTERWFVRLYRSEETESADDSPSDVLYLAVESPFLDSTDVSNGYVDLDDTTPTSVLEIPLYTNSAAGGGEGASAARFPPPYARRLAAFQSRVFYADTQNLQALELALLGVGSPDGLQDNDTISIGDLVLTAKTSPGSSTDFLLVTSETPSVNIALTAAALVRAINSESEDVYARNASADTGAPGRIRIEARTYAVEQLDVVSTRGTCWQPALTSGSDPTRVVTTDGNRHPGRLWWSPVDIPEAVPVGNNAPVGADNASILAVAPTTYRAVVFKEDGIFTVSGEAPFTIARISDALLVAPDSVGIVGDSVFALTDDGVVRIGDGAPENISMPVDFSMRNIIGTGDDADDLAVSAWGIGYSLGRQYLLWLPETATGATSTPIAWVYSLQARGWTRYLIDATAGVVDPYTRRLTLARADANSLRYEARGTDGDAYDISYSATVSVVSDDDFPAGYGFGFRVQTATAEPRVGDVIIDSNGIEQLITAIDGGIFSLFGLAYFDPDGSGTFTLRRGIPARAVFNPLTAGQPAVEKLWGQATLLFRTLEHPSISFEATCELGETVGEATATQNTWGSTEFGSDPWGNPQRRLVRVEPLPLEVAQSCQLSVGFEACAAGYTFELTGVAVQGKRGSDVNQG